MSALARLERGGTGASIASMLISGLVLGLSTSSPDPKPAPPPEARPTVIPRAEPTAAEPTATTTITRLTPTVVEQRPRRKGTNLRPPRAPPSIPSAGPTPLAIPEATKELQRGSLKGGLDRRGLTREDLLQLPNVQQELQRWEAGRAPGLEELWATLAETELPDQLLRSKLDELRRTLSQRRGDLAPEAAAQLEEAYLTLETELAQGPSKAARHRMAADVATLRRRMPR
jgi:hypothetical protein